MLTVAYSLWSRSRLVKCLSGAIKFEYRIRPDWQDIMLLLATGFTKHGSGYDFLQWAFTYKKPRITIRCRLLLLKITCVSIIIYVMIFVSTAGKVCVTILYQISYQHTDTTSTSWAPHSHDALYDPPGGVCPFGKSGVADGVNSRSPIKTAGCKGAVKEVWGFSFRDEHWIV